MVPYEAHRIPFPTEPQSLSSLPHTQPTYRSTCTITCDTNTTVYFGGESTGWVDNVWCIGRCISQASNPAKLAPLIVGTVKELMYVMLVGDSPSNGVRIFL